MAVKVRYKCLYIFYLSLVKQQREITKIFEVGKMSTTTTNSTYLPFSLNMVLPQQDLDNYEI